MTKTTTREWLNQEMENWKSLTGSIATASMVGIAANTNASTVIGTIIIWITIDRVMYEVKASK